MEEHAHAHPDRAEAFISTVLSRCGKDKGFAARLKRADNPATEAQSWGMLAQFQVNLENDRERLPFALIGAAAARAQISSDGQAGLGIALRGCFEDMEQAAPRLRRLLACDSTEELCRVLRPLLQLLAQRGRPLCYSRLLRDLLWFSNGGQRVKLRWAQEFYGQPAADENGQEG